MRAQVDLATLRRLINIGGYLRATIGVGLLLLPRLAGPGWIGPDARRRGVHPLIRALGIRDVLLGAGSIVAANEGQHLRRWTELAMIADATDAVATLLAARHIPTSKATVVFAIAVTSAAAHGWTLSQLPEEVPSTR